MQNKMQFTDLVTETFDFGWNKWFAVFKLSILPFLATVALMTIVSIIIMAVTPLILTQEMMTGEEQPPALTMFVFSLVSSIAGLLASLPMIGAGVRIFRLAGLGEQSQFWEGFRFDATFWRTVASYVIITVLLYVVQFAIMYLPGFVDFDINLIADFYIRFILFVAIYAFYIAVQVKLLPFHAATACENRLPIMETWRRTHGYFWTIFGAQLLLLLMVAGTGYIFYQGYLFFDSIGGVAAVLNSTLGLIQVPIILGAFFVGFFFLFFAVGTLSAYPAIIYRKLWA
jgi:hypothetical protein